MDSNHPNINLQAHGHIGKMHRNRTGVLSMTLPRQAVMLWMLVGALVVRQRVFVRKRENFLAIDIYAIVELAIVAVTLCLIIYRPRVLSKAWKHIWGSCASVFIVYHLFGAASALWSPLPAFSFYRAIQAGIEILAIFIAMRFCSGLIAAERWLVIMSTVVIMSILIMLGRANSIAFSLAAWHNGMLSAPSGMLACYCLGELLTGRRRSRTLVYGGLSGVAGLVAGSSSTSLCAAAFGIILGAFLARNWRVVGLGITTIFVLIAVGVGSSTARAVLFPGKSDAQITGMTGRTHLWEDYLTQFEEKPLEGQGYAVPSRISSLRYTTDTHNAYLSVLAGTGLIGAAFVIVMCMMFWNEIVGPLRCVKPGAIGCMSAMCAGAINCLGSSIVFETWNSTGVVFVSIMAIHTFYVRNGRHVRTR